MIYLNHSITKKHHSKLKYLKQETGLTMSELIRRALDEYLKTEWRDKKEEENVNPKESVSPKEFWDKYSKTEGKKFKEI